MTKSLNYEKKNGWLHAADEKEIALQFCEKYKDFLNHACTEREFCKEAEKMAKAAGFVPMKEKKSLQPGDKIYSINRGKGIMLSVIGTEPMESGVNLVGAHIDSPRLDLKQNPLFEDGSMAFLKTHYYGGIKKYQWFATPLSMHGRVILKDGTELDLSIGGEDDDFTFTVTDLLPHLADEQQMKKVKEAFDGENLNILVGSMPVAGDEVKAPIKEYILQYLHDTYNMEEEDFLSAEIEMVPAIKQKDVGFDRSMIGGPGQDDRVCAYTAMEALFSVDAPKHTAVCLLVDKEEIGSMGNTGMRSRFFENMIAEICFLQKAENNISVRRCLSASKCLSADVNAAFDPAYANAYEKNNASILGYGVTISKYTGHGGKSGSSDASAEFVAEIRKLFNDNGVIWQTAELGRVGVGGGGTIAQYVANLDIDTLDCGTALLSMHSPFEISSKMDVYMTYKAYKAFLAR
ncbi:MAG: aminopeptidase [Clostridia bacterium]|nr:aminopeptidase [Clostridia bacterium]